MREGDLQGRQEEALLSCYIIPGESHLCLVLVWIFPAKVSVCPLGAVCVSLRRHPLTSGVCFGKPELMEELFSGKGMGGVVSFIFS